MAEDASIASFNAVDLDTLLKEVDAKQVAPLSLCKPVLLSETVTLATQEKPKGRWTFKPIAIPTSGQWWLESPEDTVQGLKVGQYPIGKIKLEKSDSPWWLNVDKAFKDGEAANGELAFVRNALNSETMASKLFIGPPQGSGAKSNNAALSGELLEIIQMTRVDGVDDDDETPDVVAQGQRNVAPAQDKEYNFILDCGQDAANQIKNEERDLVDDFRIAYDVLVGGLTSLIRSVPAQKSEDDLWRELWNLAVDDTVCRGVVPNDNHLFNSPKAWEVQLASFFDDICQVVRQQRNRRDDAPHRVARYAVLFADDKQWAGNVEIGLGDTRAFEVPANTIIASIQQVSGANTGAGSRQYLTRARVGAMPRAQRQLQGLTKPEIPPATGQNASAFAAGALAAEPAGDGTANSEAASQAPAGLATGGATAAGAGEGGTEPEPSQPLMIAVAA